MPQKKPASRGSNPRVPIILTVQFPVEAGGVAEEFGRVKRIEVSLIPIFVSLYEVDINFLVSCSPECLVNKRACADYVPSI